MAFYVVPAIIVLLFIYIYLSIKKRYFAAMNVVFAKYTFPRLSNRQREDVHEHSIAMVKSSNTKIRGYENEVERFGWYAVAMKDLGIPSAVPENPAWHDVSNPYKAIKPGSMYIRGVSLSLMQNYQIEIKVSDRKKELKDKVDKDIS